MVHIRSSRPDSGLGSQDKFIKSFRGVFFSRAEVRPALGASLLAYSGTSLIKQRPTP
jgi:hypothetical protein